MSDERMTAEDDRTAPGLLDAVEAAARAAALRLGADSIEQEFHADDPAETEREEAWNTAVRAAATTLRQMANEAAAGQAPPPQRCPSCDHERRFHDVDGRCRFTVDHGVPSSSLVCPCAPVRQATAPQPEICGNVATGWADRPLGPCVRSPHGEDVAHREASGAEWWKRPAPQPEAAPDATNGLAAVCPWWKCHLVEPHPRHMGCPGITGPEPAPDAEPGTSEPQSCRSDEGRAVGAVDGALNFFYFLAERDLTPEAVQNALADMFESPEFRAVRAALRLGPAAEPGTPGDGTPNLREQYAAAIWERQNPGRKWADCEHPWGADADAEADAVLAVRDDEMAALRHQVEQAKTARSEYIRVLAEQATEDEERIAAVLALHERNEDADYCERCADGGDIHWPCATVAALTSRTAGADGQQDGGQR